MCSKTIAYFSSLVFLFSLIGGSYLISYHLNVHFEEEEQFHLKTLVLLLLIILGLMGINAWVFASVVANCLFS